MNRALIPAALVGAAVLVFAVVNATAKDKPKAAGRDCDDCIQFVPDPTRKTVGSCKVVEGEVSAHGYCLAFTPRPSTS